MKKLANGFDPWLLGLALVATLAGLFFIFDAGYARSLGANQGSWPHEFKSQLLFVLPALLCGILVSACSPDRLMRAANWLWAATLVSLVLVFKFGRVMNGAQRWLQLGPITIQPAEFAKLSAIIFFAAVLARREFAPKVSGTPRNWGEWIDIKFIPRLRRWLPAGLAVVAVMLVEKEPDLGTAAVIAGASFALCYRGGISRLSISIALCIFVLGGMYLVNAHQYRAARIKYHSTRWDPANASGSEFQSVQSELAMAEGGWTGVGLGNGSAKHLIPAPTTDFIMATVAEEFGLVGALVVLGLVGAIVFRLLWLSARAPSGFGALVLFGVAAWIALQATVNVMMANDLWPAIGIPLPFISSGGSGLVALWLALGVGSAAMRPLPTTGPRPMRLPGARKQQRSSPVRQVRPLTRV